MANGKNAQAAMFRAAVILALAGASFVSYTANATDYTGYYKPGRLDWTDSSNFKGTVNLDNKKATVDLSDLSVYNESTGRKRLVCVLARSSYEGSRDYSLNYVMGDKWTAEEVRKTSDMDDLIGSPNEWVGPGVAAGYIDTTSTLSNKSLVLANNHREHANIYWWEANYGFFQMFYKGWVVFYTVDEAPTSSLTFQDPNITWEDGATFITMDHRFDLGKDGLSFDLDSVNIQNPEQLTVGSSMVLLNDGGYYDYTGFYDKVKGATFQKKEMNYTQNPAASVTVSGLSTVETSVRKETSSDSLILTADNHVNSVTVYLDKIGKGTTDADGNVTIDQWTDGATLFSSAIGQDYATNPLTLNVNSRYGIYNNMTDESAKSGSSMILAKFTGTNADQISMKYNGINIRSDIQKLSAYSVFFKDASAGGIVASGSHQDLFIFAKDSGTYTLSYRIGDKSISDFTGKDTGIDLSDAAGGFVADDTYKMSSNVTLNVSDSDFKWINKENAKEFTLIDVSKAQGTGVLSVKSQDDAEGNTARLAGTEYTEEAAINGVTASGTKNDILFTVADGGKKINVSTASDPMIRKVTLGTIDLSKNARKLSDLYKSGTIDAENLGLTGFTMQNIAAVGKSYTLAMATGTNNFATGWTGLPTGTKNISIDYTTGITGSMVGTMNTTDGNINFVSNGLDTLTFGENIAWDTSKTAVTLTDGTLGAIDFSKISFTGKDNTATETVHLLDAKNMEGDMALTAPTDWTESTSLDSTANITTYTGNVREEKVTQEGGIEGGIALTLDRVDEIVATRIQNEDTTQNLTLDYLSNKAFAKTFAIGNGIKWVKDGTAIKLTEQYDYSQMVSQAISFDASNPYALIANPDEVGIGESMTFFDAAGYMTDDEWADKVSIANASGSSEPTYSETERAVTIEGKVNLELTKNDNKTVTGKISDEYLSKVAIDLYKIGNEETTEKNKWKAGGTLYSQTASTQDYGDANKKVEISLSGTLYGGTTDESVKAGDKMTLVHIAGNNAGVSGNLTVYDNVKKSVAFKDTAANGIVAAGTHTDTIKSETDAANNTYDVVYTIGQKVVTGISSKSVDLTKNAFAAGTQYTLGTADVTIDASQIGIANPGNGERKAIIDFSSDSGSGKFVLSNTEAKALYNETEAEAVNGVRAEGYEKNTFSLSDNAKIVYWDASERDTQLIDIGTVDFSKAVRSFNNLTKTGYIVNWNTSYIYSENTAISEVAGKKLAIAKSNGGNNFSSWIKFGGSTLPTTTEEISVTQETGISAVVKGTYDAGDNNLNLKTNGLKSLTFGENVAWNANDTAAVAISDQDIDALDVTNLSFAGADDKKNETMHLVSAQNVTNFIYDTTQWTKRAGETGTTYYDKDKDNRTHDDADNLTGYGITLAVDRGDQMVETVTTESGNTNYTLDYTRGKGYVTGMTVADSGITWANGQTAIKLKENYDFSEANLTVDAGKIKVANVSEINAGDTMTLFDTQGYMNKTDWDKIKIDPTSITYDDDRYTSNPANAIEIKGKIDIDISKDETNKKVVATVSDQYMSEIAIDISKIGEEGTGTDAWNTEKALYTNTTNKQDYAAKSVSVSVDVTGKIFGGTTDESVKTGDTMTLIDITGTNAASANAFTNVDEKSTVAFKDTGDNGLVVTGTHEDSIASNTTASGDGTQNYKVTYQIGQKVLDENSEISATELDLNQNAFESGKQYTLKDNTVTVDVQQIKIKDIGDGEGKAIIDFSEDTGGTGRFVLKDADEKGIASNSVSYSETGKEMKNGIVAAGNQYQNFSLSDTGKTVYLDSVSRDVNEVTVSRVDYAEDLRSFDNLVAGGTVKTIADVILANLSLTQDKGTNFTLAKATGDTNFGDWTLPEGEKKIQVNWETGVNGVIDGVYNTENGNLNVRMEGIESIAFSEGVKWREESVIDLAGTGIDLTGKSIDASKLSFDTDSVKEIVKTDGAYQLVLINTDDDNHLAKADFKNNDNIEMIIADTVKFKGKTTLSADGKQFIADMMRGTEILIDSTHHHVMAQDAAVQALVNGNVDTVNSISGALSRFRADDAKTNSMVFAGIGGSSTTTKTGSHISENLWNVNVGVATKKDFANGAHAEYGLYYEGGNGNYSTHYDGETLKRTSGKLTHHGAGLLFRYESKDAVYGEAGFHVGRIKNENDALGMNNSTSYYGFHLGVGKIIRTNAKDSFDIYTKFYLNRTGGMDYRNSAQTEVNLDAVTSKLLRIGGRYNHRVENNWAFYAGAAFAYEFGGNADGTAGMIGGALDSIRTAMTQGAGAILELGFRKDAAKDVPWEFDFGIKGYVGRQKGIGGNIGLKYHF